MNKEALKQVMAQFTRRELPSSLPRDLELPLHSGKVVGLIGVRRSGKTFLMYEAMRRLQAEGVGRERIIYLNLEDDRLYPIEADELDLILRAHGELYPEAQSEQRYLFLDEVQSVPGWERYVRRVYDRERVTVFVTGSSSEVLGRDLAPAMRGRSIRFEVLPLSFREYLRFKDLRIDPYNSEDEARLTHALGEYLDWGGLPEVVLADETLRPLIMEEYADLIFFRDLVSRHSIRNERVMRIMLKYCASRPASLLSVHRLHRDLRSQGIGVSKNTLYEYLDHLRDALILFTLPLHDRSIARQEQNPRKIHLIDTGLVRAFSPAPDRDMGHKLENAVFLHERRRTKEIYYRSNAHEIDLVIPQGEHTRFINVTWSLSDPATYRREQEAMAYGAKLYPDGNGTLVAYETQPPSGAVAEWPAVASTSFLLDERPEE